MKSKRIIAMLCTLAVVVSSSGGLPFGGVRLFDTAITASAETGIPTDQSEAANDDIFFANFTHISDDFIAYSGAGAANLFDGNGSNKLCAGGTNLKLATSWKQSYVEFSYSTRIVPAAIYLRTAADTAQYPSRNPKSWELYGKNSSNEWTLITSVTNDSTMGAENNTAYKYSFDNTDAYKDFKYVVTDANEEYRGDVFQGYNIQLSEIYMSGKNYVAATDISLDKTSQTVTAGESFELTATVKPDDATDKTVTWSSSDTSVATVDENGNVTAVKAGTATITATATNGTDDTADDKTATCAVTVNKAQIDPTYTITIPADVTMNANGTASASVGAEYEIGENTLSVSVASENNFQLKADYDDSVLIPYTIMCDDTQLNVDNTEILSVNGKGEKNKTLNFSVDPNQMYAGAYSDTLTFNISLT